MDVAIKERKVSFTSEYDISSPVGDFYARSAFFSLTDNIQLKTASGTPVASIRGYFSPLRNRHDFIFTDGKIYQFRCEKIWKQVYSCSGPDTSLTLVEHRGVSCSVFNEQRQIAAFVKNRIVFCNGNNYDLRVDSDANLALIICLVLTVNTDDYDDNQAGITIDFGNIGPEERPYDSSWEPR